MFDIQAKVGTKLVDPASCANTAAATSAWVLVPVNSEGDIEFIQFIGAVTGSIAGALQTADDGSGTNATTVTFNEGALTTVSSSNSIQKRSVNRSALNAYVKYTGTIVTGPVLAGVLMLSRTKSV